MFLKYCIVTIHTANKMRRRQLFIALMTFILSVSLIKAQKADDRGYIVKTGDTAPDFVIREAGGNTYRLSDLRGKIVMLQFTASWCGVCRAEMPFIEKEIWYPNRDSGLVVIGIDRDEPEETVLRFKKEMGISYPLALDPGAEIFGLYALKEAGVTRNVVIDRQGKIIFLTRLFDREEFGMMKAGIFAALGEK